MKVQHACLTAVVAFTATTQALPVPRQLLQTSGFTWPLYTQQCEDDAGPRYTDDAETFGTGKYHDKSQAIAVLQNGACPDPLKGACEARAAGKPVTPEVARASYLEGPLQCGGKGWFCRILPDAKWDGGIRRDWNFNHCNETDYGDTAGHCHGSDDDDTYYWWVRDHWYRNYAGRLHCCCDWGATLGVVARCDYRAPLRPGEADECRDANEDHTGPGSGFSLGFEAGCPNLGTTDPLPEPAEGQCWDVLNFAPGMEDENDNGGGDDNIDVPEDGDGDRPDGDIEDTPEVDNPDEEIDDVPEDNDPNDETDDNDGVDPTEAPEDDDNEDLPENDNDADRPDSGGEDNLNDSPTTPLTGPDDPFDEDTSPATHAIPAYTGIAAILFVCVRGMP